MNDDEWIKELMTLEETAKLLKVSMPTLYRYINREINPLPTFYINAGTPRVSREQFDKWINKQIDEKI